MPTITPFLCFDDQAEECFDDQAEEAAEGYVFVFPNGTGSPNGTGR